MAQVVGTASEALERYREFKAHDALVQNNWHSERDGQQLACGLGVLGSDVRSPADCPATVMPRWLAQMVPTFFDRQKPADAFDWGERFYAQLVRLGGIVPFSVVHDWHASSTTSLAILVAEKRGRSAESHLKLKALHERALAGEKIAAEEWRPVLWNAYANAYADAYAYAYADADAYADAYADADADAYADADSWKMLADGMVDALSRVVVS